MKIDHYIILFLTIFPVLGYSSGLSVAIIDTGLNKPKQISNIYEYYDFTGTGNYDSHGHGTNVAGLIHKYAQTDNYKVYSMKAFFPNKETKPYIAALRKVIELKPTILNLSVGGKGKNKEERELIIKILNQGTLIIAAAGNEGDNFEEKGCNFYPACYDKRVVIVGNLNTPSANYGKQVDIAVEGNNMTGFGVTLGGSSQSAAMVTGTTIRMLAK